MRIFIEKAAIRTNCAINVVLRDYQPIYFYFKRI
jgi:hypothetical protein